MTRLSPLPPSTLVSGGWLSQVFLCARPALLFVIQARALFFVIQARAACDTQSVPSLRLPRVMARSAPWLSAKVDQSSTPVEFSSRPRQKPGRATESLNLSDLRMPQDVTG